MEQSYKSKRREEHRAKGLCKECNESSAPNSAFCEKHKEARRLYNKKRREDHRAAGLCILCNEPLVTAHYCERHRQESMAKGKKWTAALKAKVLEHYGNKCACCGETEPVFLTIDHINSDGYKHRAKTGYRITGNALWKEIVNKGYPNTYQILCWNCNSGRAINNGVCPHYSSNRAQNGPSLVYTEFKKVS